MQYCSAEFLAAMKNPIKQMFLKFEFYDSNMNYISEFTKQVTSQDSGSISCDSSRSIRRNFSFKLINKNNEFVFGEERLIWLDKRVKVFTGLKLKNGQIEYIPQGVFILTELEDSHTPEGKFTSISAQDKSYLMVDKLGSLVNETTLSVGLNVGQAVKILAGKVGETLFSFDVITETIPYELTFQAGDSIQKAIEEICGIAKCSVFYDVNGYLRLKKIDTFNFESLPVVWSYKYGDNNERFYAGNVRKLDDSQMSNWIRTIGGSGNSATVTKDLIIDETIPMWAGNPYSIQKLGRRVYFHNNGNFDSLITTEAEALWRCKYELMRRAGYSEQLTLNSAPHFLFESDDVIQIEDDQNNVSGTYLIRSFSIPLSPQLMTIECLKFRKLLENWDFI